MKTKKQQFHIIRAEKAGVFIGRIIRTTKDAMVITTNVRRLYRWAGALDVTQIAKDGVNPSGCKFTVQLGDEDISTIFNAVEVHPISEKALQSINAVPAWKQ